MITDKWKEIEEPNEDTELAAMLASEEHPLELLMFKYGTGRIGFGFKEQSFKEPKNIKQYQGIEIVCSEENSFFALFLKDNELFSQFEFITRDILNKTHKLEENDYTTGAKIIVDELKRWKQLLGSSRKGLTPQQQIGLYGELIFLRDFLYPVIGLSNAVSSWKDGEQDYEFNKSLFEIKTQDSAKDARLTISSLNQLDLISGEIKLVRQTIGTGEDSVKGSEKLSDVIESIFKKIKNDENSLLGDIFSNCLFERGYHIEDIEKNSTYTTKYSMQKRTFYEVNENFPSLTPAKVNDGIFKAQYELNLDFISKFIIEEEEVIRKLEGLLES